MCTSLPIARIHRLPSARERYPDLVESHLPALLRGDPLADGVMTALGERDPMQAFMSVRSGGVGPAELHELLASALAAPPWLERDRLERAGHVFFRAGVLGGLTLALRSLVLGYAAPAGNKPLVLSGRLKENADTRLAQTAHFARSVCMPNAMSPEGEGMKVSLIVRLMHARVRKLALSDPRWDIDRFGLPINQHDMLATILLFSCVFVDGIRSLGVRVSPREADDFQHLYRYVGWVMGVEEQLLPRTYSQAIRMAEFVDLTQGVPDDDARQLVRVLLQGPNRQSAGDARVARIHELLVAGLCRALLGDARADQLGIPLSPARHLVTVVNPVVSLLEALRSTLSLDDFVEGLGRAYWEQSVRRGLNGERVRFSMPRRLPWSRPGYAAPQ